MKLLFLFVKHGMASNIDAIDSAFKDYVNTNTVHTLYNRFVLERAFESDCIDLRKTPFELLMWNRAYAKLERPAIHKGYNLYFAHGHDSKIPTGKNIFNLDNLLGKVINYNAQTYTILYSREYQLEPHLLPKSLIAAQILDGNLSAYRSKLTSLKSIQFVQQTIKCLGLDGELLLLKEQSKSILPGISDGEKEELLNQDMDGEQTNTLDLNYQEVKTCRPRHNRYDFHAPTREQRLNNAAQQVPINDGSGLNVPASRTGWLNSFSGV